MNTLAHISHHKPASKYIINVSSIIFFLIGFYAVRPFDVRGDFSVLGAVILSLAGYIFFIMQPKKFQILNYHYPLLFLFLSTIGYIISISYCNKDIEKYIIFYPLLCVGFVYLGIFTYHRIPQRPIGIVFITIASILFLLIISMASSLPDLSPNFLGFSGWLFLLFSLLTKKKYRYLLYSPALILAVYYSSKSAVLSILAFIALQEIPFLRKTWIYWSLFVAVLSGPVVYVYVLDAWLPEETRNLVDSYALEYSGERFFSGRFKLWSSIGEDMKIYGYLCGPVTSFDIAYKDRLLSTHNSILDVYGRYSIVGLFAFIIFFLSVGVPGSHALNYTVYNLVVSLMIAGSFEASLLSTKLERALIFWYVIGLWFGATMTQGKLPKSKVYKSIQPKAVVHQ